MARSSGWKPKPDVLKQEVNSQVRNRGVCVGVIRRNASSGSAALSPSLDVSHCSFLKDVLEGTEGFLGFICSILSEVKSDERSQRSFWS